jgi:hypothetical protein
MFRWLNRLLDRLSEYLAARKGLLPLLGLILIGLDFLLQLAMVFFLFPAWVAQLHLLLYLGLFVAIIGLMLAQAL